MPLKDKGMNQRRGGRPSRADAAKLEDKILDAAAALFFQDGYGLTSIEKIAKAAAISKRTFYARFDNKAVVFQAVVHRLIQRIRPASDATDSLFKGQSLDAVLRRIAPVILHASLSAETLALHRVVLAEAIRFPELALIMHEQSSRQEALDRIARLIEHEIKLDPKRRLDPLFMAEQFLFMLIAAPQRRALGLGAPMTNAELETWAQRTVDLFLNGVVG